MTAYFILNIINWWRDFLDYAQKHPDVLWGGIGTTFLGFLLIQFRAGIKYLFSKWWQRIRDNSGMGKHSQGFNKVFEDRNFTIRLQGFIEHLRQKVHHLNEDARWNSEYFTSLDAEVEMRIGNSKKKKVTDLLRAIKVDKKSNAFLILGDPGSGKSVALRKLWEYLLKEVGKTQKIPLYVNLKEWIAEEKWTKANPPTSKDLCLFIYEQFVGQNEFTDAFLEDYFYTLFQNGYLFLIIDSFDEIPLVLDEKENSWLIEKLSEVIYFTITNSKNSRGLLASRPFRCPTSKFRANTKLFIRPFTIKKIQQTLLKSVNFNESLMLEIFNERYDLISLARNPFTTSLLASYVQNNYMKLPINKADLYSNYIIKRLSGFEKYNVNVRLTKEQLLDKAKELSYFIFESDKYGLEIPLTDAKKIFGSEIEEVLLVFQYTKIGKITHGFNPKFSFVHRRFYEYFVAQKLLDHPDKVSIESIPRDSRWRDALVLYCEIAPLSSAITIANFCWAEYISKFQGRSEMDPILWLEVIHTFRFFIDAFKTRKECLDEFIDGYHFLIRKAFRTYSSKATLDILELNIFAQSIGLLPEGIVAENVSRAILLKSKLVSESALNSCRHLPTLGRSTIVDIVEFYDSIDNLEFLLQSSSYLYTLKLSNSFSKIYQFAFLKVLWYCFTSFLLLSLFIINPLLIIPFIIIEITVPYVWLSYSYLLKYDDATMVGKIIGMVLINFFVNSRGIKRILFILLSLLLIHEFSFQINILSIEKYNFLQRILLICLFPIPVALPFFLFNNFILLRKKQKSKVTFSFPKTNFESIFSHTKVLAVDVSSGINKWYKNNPIKITLRVIAIISIPLALIYWHKEIEIFFRLHWKIIVGILLLMVSMLYLLIRTFKKIHDMRLITRVKRFNKNELWNRLVIEGFFRRFKTSKSRYQFVKFLYDEDIQVTGAWKELIVPSFQNDDASDLLARLESKWLGLEK